MKPQTMTDTNNTEGFIPPHGGYRKLITYQKAEIIYDGTSCTKRQAKHCRSKHGLSNFQGNRDKTDQCGAGRPGVVKNRLINEQLWRSNKLLFC